MSVNVSAVNTTQINQQTELLQTKQETISENSLIPEESIAIIDTEEQSDINTNNSTNSEDVNKNTNISSSALFGGIDEIRSKFPSELLKEDNFSAELSRQLVAETLSELFPHLNIDNLKNSSQNIVDLMKNNPEYATKLRETLSEIYSPDDTVQIFMSIASDAVTEKSNTDSETNHLSRSFRASRDGLQPSSAMMAFGRTGWVENSGIPEASNALNVLANFSTLINIKKWEGEIVSGDVGLAAGGNLGFATLDGISYAFTHFDGTFGPTGSVMVKLSDNNILKLSGEILHESTHLGDNAMQEGMRRHNDSAEWFGGEVAFQHLNSPVEFEIYGAVDKYFHSMTTHPLEYKLEAGATVSAFDRRLNLSAEIDTVKAGESSSPVVVGDIEGLHTGGKVKLLYSPIGNGTGLTVSYDFGADSFGQNIGETNNRVLVGFQASDHIAELLRRKK